MLKKLILAINIFSQAYTVGNELGSYEKKILSLVLYAGKNFNALQK